MLSEHEDNDAFVTNRWWFNGGLAIASRAPSQRCTFPTPWIQRFELWARHRLGLLVSHIPASPWRPLGVCLRADSATFILTMLLLVPAYYALSAYKDDFGNPYGGSVPMVRHSAFLAQGALASPFTIS